MAVADKTPSLLTSAQLNRMAGLDFVARQIVEGFITGKHRSPFQGFSVEFSQYRDYAPGDSLKFLDWKKYAKSDRLYIKQYEQETNLRCFLAVDASGSMDFAPGGPSKWDYARYLAAALAFLLIRQQDALGLVTVQAGGDSFVPPRSHRTHLDLLFRQLAKTKAKGETDLAASLRKLAEKLPRRCLVLVISDFLAPLEGLLQSLRLIRSRHAEVILFPISHPLEESLDFPGATAFVDLETDAELKAEPWHIRKSYAANRKAHFQALRRFCLDHSLEICPLRTDTPWDRGLTAFLKKREKLL
jgi:uncharacterized protein (DUF58 family)